MFKLLLLITEGVIEPLAALDIRVFCQEEYLWWLRIFYVHVVDDISSYFFSPLDNH